MTIEPSKPVKCRECGLAVRLVNLDNWWFVACDQCVIRTHSFRRPETAVEFWNAFNTPPTELPWRPATELPQEGDWITVERWDGTCSSFQFRKCETLVPTTYRWLLLRRLPPRPDAFEEWWRKVKDGNYCAESIARDAWDAARAAAKA